MGASMIEATLLLLIYCIYRLTRVKKLEKRIAKLEKNAAKIEKNLENIKGEIQEERY